MNPPNGRAERRRLLQAQIAIERAELVLAIGDLRRSTTPASLARDVTGGLWRSLMRRGSQRAEAMGGPAATVLLDALRRYPLLASTLTALLPFARRFIMRRLSVKRVLWGAAAAGAGWLAYKTIQKT